NLAARYGLSEIGPNDADPWEALFKAGKRDRKDGSGDLVPFWIYTEGEYAFRWNEIPGKDSARLIEILKQKFGIDWAKNAKIEKIENGKVIKVSAERNSLLLRLIYNDNEIEVILEIGDGRTDKLIAKIENDVLNIYSKGEAKIERHVPALPLSRDRERMEQLQKSLVVYRMVFGQSRQEDLAAFLMSRLDKVDMDKLRIDLSPPRNAKH
ncbi:MAG TPA: hypothetical protein PKL29_09340, partial [Methanothrix sp.]|nr:hypothetical protein [Methanothrix sp.]